MRKSKLYTAIALTALVFLSMFGMAATAVQAATFVPSDLNVGDKYHVAFITEGTRNAFSSDIADYNAFAQSQAELSGAITENWGVSWFAIGSTTSVDAKDNIPVNTAPIYLLTDVRLADNAADLWDGSIQTIFSVTQFGTSDDTADETVWTGTQSDGTKLLTQALGDAEPRYGFSGLTTSDWVSFGNEARTQINAFYAVSEELTVVPVPAAVWLLGGGLIGLLGIRRRFKN